jgi:hypothetical protein
VRHGIAVVNRQQRMALRQCSSIGGISEPWKKIHSFWLDQATPTMRLGAVEKLLLGWSTLLSSFGNSLVQGVSVLESKKLVHRNKEYAHNKI